MGDYIKVPIVDGKPVTDVSETYQGEKSKGDKLGKDAFLRLLVAQMEYQDPLKPADNTQMVAELAQFSTLEELQNVGSTLNNMNAFGLVGKNVIIEAGMSSGSTTTNTVGGYVQYVKMVDGKAKLSINGELYDYDDLKMVVDDAYLDWVLGQGGSADNTENDGTGGTESGDTENGGTGGTESDKPQTEGE